MISSLDYEIITLHHVYLPVIYCFNNVKKHGRQYVLLQMTIKDAQSRCIARRLTNY